MNEVTPKKQSKTEWLDERVKELRARLKITGPNQLTEAVSLPPEMAAALMTGRPELLKLMQPRVLTVDEAKNLINAVAVLIETNMALQQHAQDLEQLVKNWTDGFKALESVGMQIRRFAEFKTREEFDDETENEGR